MGIITEGAYRLELIVSCESYYSVRDKSILRHEIRRQMHYEIRHVIHLIEVQFMRVVWRVEKVDWGLKFIGLIGPDAVEQGWLMRRKRKGKAFVAHKPKVPEINLLLQPDGEVEVDDLRMQYYERR